MPSTNSATAMKKVGSTILRSFCLSAGRKNARTSQKMMGLQTTAAANSATRNFRLKPPKALSTTSLSGMNSWMGNVRNSMIWGEII